MLFELLFKHDLTNLETILEAGRRVICTTFIKIAVLQHPRPRCRLFLISELNLATDSELLYKTDF